MTQSSTQNRRFVLAERPKGEPDDKTLRLEVGDLPAPGKGEMLLRNEHLSLDPYMRGRMSKAPSYAPPVEIGEVIFKEHEDGYAMAEVFPAIGYKFPVTDCKLD